MAMIAKLRSTWMDTARYDDTIQALDITLLDGTVTRYCNVPFELWVELVGAVSAGAVFNTKIKGVYDAIEVDDE